MIKTKYALLSMIVFLTVFCLSAIFNIQSPYNTVKEEKSIANEITISSTNALEVDAKDMKLQSLSYKTNAITLRDNEFSTTDDNTDIAADINTVQEDTSQALEAASLETDTSQEEIPTASQARAGFAAEVILMQAATENSDTEQQSLTGSEASQNSEPKAADTDEKNLAETKALYSNIAISIAKDFVNIRKEASTDSQVLGKLYRDSAAEILDKEGDWYYVESGSVKGYVKAEYLKTCLSDDELLDKYGTQSMVVKADGLNVRSEMSTESKRLTVIYQNEVYPVIEQHDEWIKIDVSDEALVGYVKREFAELIVDFKDAVSKEEEEELLRIKAEERARKETEIKYRDEVNYTADDLKLLACLVHAEAGTQSYEGKLAVANIVLNRVKSSKYADSISAVIYQPGQFSVARSGSLDKQLANYDNYSSKSQLLSVKAAKSALEGANNIGSRLYFHTYRAAVKKGYDEKSTCVKIEDHLFW